VTGHRLSIRSTYTLGLNGGKTVAHYDCAGCDTTGRIEGASTAEVRAAFDRLAAEHNTPSLFDQGAA